MGAFASLIRTLPLAMLLLAGCAGEPDIEQAIQPDVSGRPLIVGSHGPLTQRQSETVLSRLKAEAKEGDLLERHLAIEQALSGHPLVAGNRVTVVGDGSKALERIFAAIAEAKSTVDLEYYIFEDVESGGRRLVDLLLDKRRQGVAVNIIYDGFGSLGTPREVFDRLKAAGAALVEYNPLNPLNARVDYSPNDRDHRKILVVDGKLAFTGGVNIAADYESHPFGKLVGSDGTPNLKWRDLDVIIEGPAVAELQRVFLDHWVEQRGPAIDESPMFPKIDPMGNEVIRVIASSSRDPVPPYYATLISAIRNAQERIHVTTAYFVPTKAEIVALIEAAHRGVEVSLLLPGISDSDFALHVGHAAYGELLKAGIKIHETRNEILHAKVTVIDGVWSVVGSSNFDHRSVLFNDEIDAVILGRSTAQRLEEVFENGMAESTPIELVEWRKRPLGERLKELFAAAWQSLL